MVIYRSSLKFSFYKMIGSFYGKGFFNCKQKMPSSFKLEFGDEKKKLRKKLTSSVLFLRLVFISSLASWFCISGPAIAFSCETQSYKPHWIICCCNLIYYIAPSHAYLLYNRHLSFLIFFSTPHAAHPFVLYPRSLTSFLAMSTLCIVTVFFYIFHVKYYVLSCPLSSLLPPPPHTHTLFKPYFVVPFFI